MHRVPEGAESQKQFEDGSRSFPQALRVLAKLATKLRFLMLPGALPTGIALQGFPHRDNYPCKVIPVGVRTTHLARKGLS